ncbi:MAG: glycosyltransferase family 2 protein [Chloracidobacterium sp.]|nr:glycosyltransferase family 2 protein [Chloracidobacterium sp.]
MNTKPIFSVVMPTRDRAEHLPNSIASVLDQTFRDFELVIGDSFSQDSTPDVVKAFDDKRIKYFRSEKPLAMCDSHEHALSHASGEYILFLSDDDAFTPVTLERIRQVIDENSPEVMVFRGSQYYRDGDFQHERQIPANTLATSKFGGNVHRLTREEAIGNLFRMYGLNGIKQNDDFIPYYQSNSVVHHSVYARIKAVRNEIFAVTPIDMYLAAAVIFATDHYYCLDEPMFVLQNWSSNTTASAHKKQDSLREHYEKLLDGEVLQYTPLKFALPLNCIIDAILRAKADFDLADEVKVSWYRYYVFSFDNLMYLRSAGVNVDREVREFIDVLAQEPEALQRRVMSNIKKLSFKLKQAMRKFPLVFRMARRLLINRRSDKFKFVGGAVNGFEDVRGAGRYLYVRSLDGKVRRGTQPHP